MDLAIAKAKNVGIGWVSCKGESVRVFSVILLYIYTYTGSNHFGIAGYYSMMAIKKGLLVS